MRSSYLTGTIIAAALLFWALADHAYGYYILLQWIVCGVSVWGVFIFMGRGKPVWIVALAVIAILFNPVVPVHLFRATWAPIDIVAGLVLLASGFAALRRTRRRAGAASRGEFTTDRDPWSRPGDRGRDR
ncbi:MAG TPA: DUF6804 family protein [Acidobacteriota bacterium]|nr:DUF6804 family protein [Acidobacteriota bacterium]